VDTSGRRTGWFGAAFVILLLLQAGMADIPTSDVPVDRIQAFYAANGGVIVAAQIISIAASIFFLLFAWNLGRDLDPESASANRRLRLTGTAVSIASVATAVPPIVLALASSPGDATARNLTRAADVTDAILFVAIGLFALELLRAGTARWLRASALVVAVLSLARAVLGIAEMTTLDVIAPLAFLALVLALSVAALRRKIATPTVA
jgi:hypothetical protein